MWAAEAEADVRTTIDTARLTAPTVDVIVASWLELPGEMH